MIRVGEVVEKNIRPDPPKILTLVANTATDALKDISTTEFACVEFSARYIQNLTGADLYFCFGQDCAVVGGANPTKNYHGILPDKAQLDCSNHGCRVSVLSVAGGDISITLLRRRDMNEHVTILPSDQLSVP